MAAFFISDVTIKDPEAFQIYRARAASSIVQYGGRYLTRGGKIQPVEGEWFPRIIVIVEFADTRGALAWYHSPEYARALAVRAQALSRNLILVDGMDDVMSHDGDINW
ncbi:DUF1330 domain-containing protein [Salmonella enterica]|nr:DUF1330 domain-containing protein [Salmonella enterica]